MRWVPGEVCRSHREVTVWHEQDPPGASGPHQLYRCRSARWKAALCAWRRRDDSGSVKVRSKGGLAGSVWCAAPPPSVPDSAHAVLRWRPGRREEPPGSQNHRSKAGGVQHLGLPVQQLGAGSVHLQGAVGLLRLRSDIGQVLRAEGKTGRSVKKRNETTAKTKSETN